MFVCNTIFYLSLIQIIYFFISIIRALDFKLNLTFRNRMYSSGISLDFELSSDDGILYINTLKYYKI